MMVPDSLALVADALGIGAHETPTSEEALERLPSMSFSRWNRIALTEPSGAKRGMRKQLNPSSAWASTRKASHIGADMNHLWPVMR